MAEQGETVMTLPLDPIQVPIRYDEHGVPRIANTRVPLETVVGEFREGATAEEIVQRFPALSLQEVYTVITYYLGSKAEVDAYVDEREREADRIHEEYQSRFDMVGIRERLLARRKVQE